MPIKEPMKILQINKYHYYRGGAERVFFNTMDLLRSHGHQVIPFTTRHPKNIPADYDNYFVEAPEIKDLGTAAKFMAFPRFFYNHKARKPLRELLEKEKPDVAHIHNFFNGLSLSILPELKRNRVPVCITIHDPRLVCGSANWKMPGRRCDSCRKMGFLPCFLDKCMEGNTILSAMMMLENFQKEFLFNFDKYIDKYIFLNEAYRDAMSEGHDFFRDKSEILCNFTPGKPVRGLPRGNYMLYFGRLTTEKGLHTLIEAARQNPDIQIHLAGSGPMEEELRRTAPENVVIRGFLSGSDLTDEINGASFILLPSEWMENNPMTIIEAYLVGKPAIGSRIGGIPELIVDGVTGFLLPPKDMEAWTKTLRRAADMSDADYSRMSNAAADFAEANFSPDYHYGRLMEIYNSIIP